MTIDIKKNSYQGGVLGGKELVVIPNDIEIDIPDIESVPLSDMIFRVRNEPPSKMVFLGIKEKSFGLICGKSKSGKSIFAENLAISIASGEGEFLGKPIDIDNRVVMIFHLEEHYKHRTERNDLQVARLIGKHGANWLKDIRVVGEDMPRNFTCDKDWELLTKMILKVKPGVVILDSLGHLHTGSIEDSTVAKGVMGRLRNLCEVTDTTLLVIHHTHKMYNRSLILDTIAGSRVVVQEVDFCIGLNTTESGKHYIKEVFYRHAQCNSETVKQFEITDECWINVIGETEEYKLLNEADGRKDASNKNDILEFFQNKKEAEILLVEAEELNREFVLSKTMSKQTLYSNLDKLVKEGLIVKEARGKYRLPE